MSRDYTLRYCQSRKDRRKRGKKAPKALKTLKPIKTYKKKDEFERNFYNEYKSRK